ncbi:selenide, water dikinase SelD, partial [Proteus mirabilis]
GCVPVGTGRNVESYCHLIGNISEMQRKVLCDPQTSGGLLLAVQPEAVEPVKEVAKRFNIDLTSIGELTQPKAGSALI